MKKSRTKHSAEFKAKVALGSADASRHTVPEIARRYGVHPNLVYKWKRQLSENAARVFEVEGRAAAGHAASASRSCCKKIGELTVERDFLANGLGRLR